MEVSWIVGGVLGCISIAGAAAGLADRRRRELAELWKGIAEARQEENNDLRERMSRLEAKVELLESGFIRDIAKGLVEYLEEHDGKRT